MKSLVIFISTLITVGVNGSRSGALVGPSGSIWTPEIAAIGGLGSDNRGSNLHLGNGALVGPSGSIWTPEIAEIGGLGLTGGVPGGATNNLGNSALVGPSGAISTPGIAAIGGLGLTGGVPAAGLGHGILGK